MKACGIIVEYNPFHNGHSYHAKKARELTGADVVVAVMSGNFLQRGEPAIIDKWQRANAALQNGVDLVIELPVEWSMQPADLFARGAIGLLQALGCEFLCFGTDQETFFDYQAFGRFVLENQEKIDLAFQKITDPSLTYPQKMMTVLQEIYPPLQVGTNQPNHILGLSYAQENAKYPNPMQLFSVKREGAGYHSTELTQTIASATAIRQAVGNHHSVTAYVPEQTAAGLKSHTVTWENYWPLLQYRILSSTLTELREIYQMVDGLEFRLKKVIQEADNFEELVTKLKTKRYTQARIQRLLCSLLLNLKQTDLEEQWQKQYLHILGFTKNGQAFLTERKKKSSLPYFSKIGKKEEAVASLMIRSDQIYQLGATGIKEQNFGRHPWRLLK